MPALQTSYHWDTVELLSCRTLPVCPLVEDWCMDTTALHLSSQALSLKVLLVRLSAALSTPLYLFFLSERVVILCHYWMLSCLFPNPHLCFWTLCAGLSGSLNRSSGSDIKREDKEDDENCSVTDRSEDEKKDMKARLRTRFLTFILINHYITFHGI